MKKNTYVKPSTRVNGKYVVKNPIATNGLKVYYTTAELKALQLEIRRTLDRAANG